MGRCGSRNHAARNIAENPLRTLAARPPRHAKTRRARSRSLCHIGRRHRPFTSHGGHGRHTSWSSDMTTLPPLSGLPAEGSRAERQRSCNPTALRSRRASRPVRLVGQPVVQRSRQQSAPARPPSTACSSPRWPGLRLRATFTDVAVPGPGSNSGHPASKLGPDGSIPRQKKGHYPAWTAGTRLA